MPPPGAALARCPDAAPAGCHRQGAHCCADTPGVQGANRRRVSGMMLSRCRHPAQRWRVARMQPVRLPQAGGALLRRYARRSGCEPSPRQRHDAEPLPPPGAALARCPDAAPAGCHRQGAHCCADTPGVQGANRRRASGMMLSRCRHPAQRWRVARMQPVRLPQAGGALLRRYARRSGCEPSPRQRHDAEPLPPPGAALARCPDAAPAGCHRQGAHCCADTPGVQGANRRRASGMILSRCCRPAQRWRVARMKPGRLPQAGAHCCADTPGVQGANRRRASGMMLSRCRHPAQRWRVARMQLRQVATGRGRTAAQIRPAFRVRTVAAPAA
ncbi:hypothetical protein [Escherichia coli]|uniref:hypothetical protein n=1 Tax=Escherichia coli TaxID=562 RepID=UPI0018EEC124|nr:hypothetical protein [Escherichia coli]MBJ6678483.1 hypothetical protein [Escherichia coli]